MSVQSPGGQHMFPCLSCFPSLCAALFKPARGKTDRPSLRFSLSLCLSLSLSLSLSPPLSLCVSLSLHQQSDHCLPLRTKSWKISCGATLFHYITSETPNCCRVPEMSCVQNMVSSKSLSLYLSHCFVQVSVSTFM